MKSYLPPLRALQAFEAFGRLGSVGGAAQELGVTSGAISQQLKVLEEYLSMKVINKDGRRAALSDEALAYHRLVTEGFDRLRMAQTLVQRAKMGADLKVSGLPTLLLKWLNPLLHDIQSHLGDVPLRLEATHLEPDPDMTAEMFRLTYGNIAQRFPHARKLFTDVCFPACSPALLKEHPEARSVEGLLHMPLIDIDWGPAYRTVPRWADWFSAHGLEEAAFKPVAVHSLSSSALEAAAGGQGVVLAQQSFARFDLELGRLVRLAEDSLPMPEPYYVCWGETTLHQPKAREFLNWLMAMGRDVSTDMQDI
ncbi:MULTISPECIES: LysR substrate-binding domain-containing protein [Mameliella]|uniref:Transcriptional regulator, LysR family n=1 Tax=Mameliella alba TaxID=561184 RepID=A0A0B3RK57_9RHOB|nr:LysR substrate-binding domain-containing protein [Mameliella alba]KHQ51630.1 Transcriptional regulator, LysR family [Mameliella alba]OWV53670.1 LysR family transcriptional regulator [Mameliella alba]